MRHKFLRKYLPGPEAVLAKPWCAPFRPWLGHPSLWHLNRRSVPGAVGIGLFCGLIPGPFQMLAALIVSIPLRKNIPVALATTLYTNPFTIVPLYLLAYGYGRLLVGGDKASPDLVPPGWDLAALWHWCLGLGRPLAVGLFALALTLALAGYFAAWLGWRAHVALAWRRRKKNRQGGP